MGSLYRCHSGSFIQRPPQWFEEDKAGYLCTCAFIGSMAGLIISGLVTNVLNKNTIRLNKGPCGAVLYLYNRWNGNWDRDRLTLYRIIIVEAITCILVFKRNFSFVLTLYAYGWLAHGGLRHYDYHQVQVGICLLSINPVLCAPLYLEDAESPVMANKEASTTIIYMFKLTLVL
ncbi:Major facilitator superfamily domain general substrate transporter [Penicillium taxi]|uniref:Major facilitator superfamily domain general substrate transporter n=1 Tax=Penicillium taxi TaxID=168475 RepID=UPI002544D4B2|nr:Major facilitator superfamily domain general substrate transporter [Penicillium taxi]KAJ5894380.1 Major facilitator superfamily domain general substrate transporter [Penicillium taxi]